MNNTEIINKAVLNTIMTIPIDSIESKCHPLLCDGRKSYMNQEPKMMFVTRLEQTYVLVDRDSHGNGTISDGGTIMSWERFTELQAEFGVDMMPYSQLPTEEEVI